MVISAKIVTKSGKKGKKNRPLDTVGDNAGALFMWSVCISQYSNRGKKGKKRINMM